MPTKKRVIPIREIECTIEEHGSTRKAAKVLGISYNAVWLRGTAGGRAYSLELRHRRRRHPKSNAYSREGRYVRIMWYHIWGISTGEIATRVGITQPAVVHILRYVIGEDIYVPRMSFNMKADPILGDIGRIRAERFQEIEAKLHPEPMFDGVKILHRHIGVWIYFYPEDVDPGEVRQRQWRAPRMEIIKERGNFYTKWDRVFRTMAMSVTTPTGRKKRRI